jgi:fumarate reductase subunit C
MYAVRGGLSGSEILARTRGSLAFTLFYGIFVLACAAHVPVGLANIAQEWLGWDAGRARLLSLLAAVLILAMGWAAVYGVTLS